MGQVKTRIAKSLGDAEALKIYTKLLNYTLREANCALWDTAVYFAGNQDSGLNLYDFQVHKQKGEDLGEKMNNAFESEFKSGADRVVVIGADCADLKLNHIEKAFWNAQTS